MSILSLIAASLIVVPQPNQKYLQTLFRAYPTRAIQEGKSGAVLLRTWLDPKGEIYRCEVLQVFGDGIFGREACTPFSRLRMEPASSPDGSSSFGMKTTFMRYMVQGPRGREIQEMQQPADITLGAPSPAPDFNVAVQVQADGNVSHCEGLEGATGEIVDRACAEATRLGQIGGTDKAGNSVRYVTSLLVRVEARAS